MGIVLAAMLAAATVIGAAVYVPGARHPRVVVDAGPGAPDGGAVGINGTEEKDINLSIALKLREVLEGKGIEVIMMRESDSGIWDEDAATIREKKLSDMQNRLQIIKKAVRIYF